jgi:L-aspartate oxidase
VREQAGHVEVFEDAFALDLATSDGAVVGVWARHQDGSLVLHRARAVVLATGGTGQLFSHTTNPKEATGDGLAMAARAGATLADLEFVQFHPTALAVDADPMPLLTEALRGRGAVIVDETGRRFLFDYDPKASWPRATSSRAGSRCTCAPASRAFLDARPRSAPGFAEEFPTVHALCARHGLDPSRELVPIAPAAHYHMGGVLVDENGKSELRGLWPAAKSRRPACTARTAWPATRCWKACRVRPPRRRRHRLAAAKRAWTHESPLRPRRPRRPSHRRACASCAS